MANNFDTLVARREENTIERRRAVTNKLPKGVKAAKAKKWANPERDVEDDAYKDAIYSLSDKFGEVSSATIAAANVRHEQSHKHGAREEQLKKGADELEAVRVLFSDDDGDNKMYRNTLKWKCLCKPLEKEEQSSKVSRLSRLVMCLILLRSSNSTTTVIFNKIIHLIVAKPFLNGIGESVG